MGSRTHVKRLGAFERILCIPFVFSCRAMLPAALVQPVVVKNTFLDFDDSCLKRSSRRCKTEGQQNHQQHVEPYESTSTNSSPSAGSTASGGSRSRFNTAST